MPTVFDLEPLPGRVQISTIITTPGGRQFRAVVLGRAKLALVNASDDAGDEIIVEGPGALSTASSVLGALADAIGDALKAIVAAIPGPTCTTSTTFTTNAKGEVTGFKTTRTCVQ